MMLARRLCEGCALRLQGHIQKKSMTTATFFPNEV